MSVKPSLTEISPELKTYISQYFKEYHIKDCLIFLPATMDFQPDDINALLGQQINPGTNEKAKIIIQHVSSNPSTEGLSITLAPFREEPTNESNQIKQESYDSYKPQLTADDELHELINDYLSRLAILVEKTISREPKPVAIWKHRNFLSSISHQIKTPLSAIFSGSKLIKHYINDDRIDRICEYMNQSCVELTRYMNDIIDFYYLKQDTLILENSRVIISDTLNYVYENYKLQMIDASIQFSAQISHDIPEIKCDEHRLTQILMNLINNSIKFISHPELDDSNQTDEQYDKIINVSVSVVLGKLIIQVSDTGIGRINLDNQEVYFQPFNQTTRNWLSAPDGIGLGLCLSRDFARKMGGDLYFIYPPNNSSNIVYNTCIELVLPVINDKPSTTLFEPSTKIKNPADEKNIDEKPCPKPCIKINTHQNNIITKHRENIQQQIVLIDDNQTNLELLKLILQQLGYSSSQIKAFSNSIEGQQYIIQNTRLIAHAIIDIRMPRKNGLDIISELAPICSNIHYILLTALNYSDIRDKYSQILSINPSTRISLLFKPIDCNELNKLLSPGIPNKPSSGRQETAI